MRKRLEVEIKGVHKSGDEGFLVEYNHIHPSDLLDNKQEIFIDTGVKIVVNAYEQSGGRYILNVALEASRKLNDKHLREALEIIDNLAGELKVTTLSSERKISPFTDESRQSRSQARNMAFIVAIQKILPPEVAKGWISKLGLGTVLRDYRVNQGELDLEGLRAIHGQLGKLHEHLRHLNDPDVIRSIEKHNAITNNPELKSTVEQLKKMVTGKRFSLNTQSARASDRESLKSVTLQKSSLTSSEEAGSRPVSAQESRLSSEFNVYNPDDDLRMGSESDSRPASRQASVRSSTAAEKENVKPVSSRPASVVDSKKSKLPGWSQGVSTEESRAEFKNRVAGKKDSFVAIVSIEQASFVDFVKAVRNNNVPYEKKEAGYVAQDKGIIVKFNNHNVDVSIDGSGGKEAVDKAVKICSAIVKEGVKVEVKKDSTESDISTKLERANVAVKTPPSPRNK